MTTDDTSQSTETAPLKRAKKTQPAKRQRQLRVAFDTNVLYTGSASDLVRHEAASLIAETTFPDLQMLWYLPDVVRHERQFQMQKAALALLPHVAKVEKLITVNLNITEAILIEQVERAVMRRAKELQFATIKLDYAQINWDRLVLDALYRRPPFEDGSTEKGFRDALVVESFLQLVAESPKSAATCRVVLVSADKLVRAAAEARIQGFANVRVLSSIDELKGLINTLASEASEELIAALQPKASRLFFSSEDETGLYYKANIHSELESKFSDELKVVPPGASSRKNGTWRISMPTFAKKIGQRVYWISRIDIDTQAFKLVEDESRFVIGGTVTPSNPFFGGPIQATGDDPSDPYTFSFSRGGQELLMIPTGKEKGFTLSSLSRMATGGFRNVKTYEGSDAYEVLWHAELTTTQDLRKPTLEDVRHVEATWNPA